MTRAESGRALLRAFGDAARMIATGYDPRGVREVYIGGGSYGRRICPADHTTRDHRQDCTGWLTGRASRRSAAYQRGLLAAFATAYGS